MSEPKRPLLESSTNIQAPNTAVVSKVTSSGSVPAATSQTNLFVGRCEARTDGVSHAVQEDSRSRKRKEMEAAEIQMDELESLMSEDMDFFDEQPSSSPAQLVKPGLTEQKQRSNTAETLSSSKRQRLHLEENGKSQKPHVGLEKEPQKNQNSKPHVVSIKTEPPEDKSTYYESSKPSSCTDVQPFEEDELSFIGVRIHSKRS